MPMALLGALGLAGLLAAQPAGASANPPGAADAAPAAGAAGATESSLTKLLAEEAAHALENLALPDGAKPYYLSYTVTDEHVVNLAATLGSQTIKADNRRRILDVDLRVGDYQIDNTHKIRGEGFDFGDFGGMGGFGGEISMEDEPLAIRHALWLATDRKFKAAAKRYQRVMTNLKTKVEEEDKAGDFTKEPPSVYFEPPLAIALDRDAWIERLKRVSALARKHPLIYSSQVSLAVGVENRSQANSEGTRLQTSRKLMRVVVSADTKAEDGMDIGQSFIFSVSDEARLPSEEEIAAAFGKVIAQVEALRAAPLVEPYTGPAILVNRASGVFFHEIFGHRIEGHRQKDVDEGQTFTKKINEAVLPEFISVHDNPTLARFNDIDLRGFYKFDDEGVAAQDVRLVENGILKTFLMSRSPVQTFAQSNGHGRRSAGGSSVSRQGNLMVTSTKQVPFAQLRSILLEECRRQEKPYGLLFEDITGGFTTTRRAGPQAFKVLPVVVYRVYADGRPDELVRGVDIVGTPLACFAKIIATGDDPDVFNGTCGAESGWVPVAAISPSILVSQIEIEKRRRDQDKPPLLAPPISEGEGAAALPATSQQEGA